MTLLTPPQPPTPIADSMGHTFEERLDRLEKMSEEERHALDAELEAHRNWWIKYAPDSQKRMFVAEIQRVLTDLGLEP